VMYRIVLFFFFQAEDGIRDRNVTGVQTCALPISHRVRFRPKNRDCVTYSDKILEFCGPKMRYFRALSYRALATSSGPKNNTDRRSEERRVGKESRSRRTTCEQK